MHWVSKNCFKIIWCIISIHTIDVLKNEFKNRFCNEGSIINFLIFCSYQGVSHMDIKETINRTLGQMYFFQTVSCYSQWSIMSMLCSRNNVVIIYAVELLCFSIQNCDWRNDWQLFVTTTKMNCESTARCDRYIMNFNYMIWYRYGTYKI